MKHFLAQSELEHEIKSVDFILATQRQIAKDFGMSGIEFESWFTQDPLPYVILTEIIEMHLGQIMQIGERPLLQLLYQIDIPQTDFLKITTEADFLEKLSNLVIRREAYKVYLRQRF